MSQNAKANLTTQPPARSLFFFALPMGWATNYLISYFWYRTGNWEKRNLLRGGA